ncbi:phage tail tape measure protein [Streptomyces californicus]
MADDAEQAGQQAGQALGDGFTQAADGSVRDARGRYDLLRCPPVR